LVTSSQDGVHPHLHRTVRRHLETRWSQPLHQPTLDAYRQLEQEGIFSTDQPMILDSGCGTGKSTQKLAALHPGHLVIGADRSRVRLGRSGVNSNFSVSGNCILLRAELATLWRLLARDRRLPERHFILYPNPWPKPGHLSRRWHGHPVFPWLLALGGEIELRCNWEIYALEFALAVQIATGETVKVEHFQPASSVSPFEKKYLERGQLLFRVAMPASITAGFDSAILT
jgi:tRNA (guanine-N7-)-methyltransferase